ncbi:MAG: M67 family metallopeptidase [Pyrinomonadaceae bacterium]
MLRLYFQQLEAMIEAARAASPNECCGLMGGVSGRARSVYPLFNAALNTQTAYEAAPEDLFAAQRQMRERGESLLAIYHSHPRQADPFPSETDIRLAYYPQAIYFIVGLTGPEPRLGAFRIFADEGRWEPVEYTIESTADNRT